MKFLKNSSKLIMGMVPCNDYEERVVEAVKNFIDTAPVCTMITNKEWSYCNTENGQEIVTLTGEVTNPKSEVTHPEIIPINFQFYIEDGYIVKMRNTDDDGITIVTRKDNMSKLDI